MSLTDQETAQADAPQPKLGLATTRQILEELTSRLWNGNVFDVTDSNGLRPAPGVEPTLDLDYSTVGGERGVHLEDSNLVAHAERELRLSGQTEEDPDYAASIVRAVKEFASQRHSGGSASVAIEQLHRLLRFETLSPLTSDPDEWEDRTEMSGHPLWQNRRDSRAMSEDGGKTWWFVSARHAGERCYDGGEMGTLVCCPDCHGDGLRHQRDEQPAPVEPDGALS